MLFPGCGDTVRGYITSFRRKAVFFVGRSAFSLARAGSRADRFFTRIWGSELFTYRQVFGMLIPLILDQLSINLISVLATSMISASSQESVSAVSLVNPAIMLITALYGAIASGGAVIVAQYKGRGDEERVRLSAGQSMLAIFSAALLCSVLLIAGARPLLGLLYRGLDPVVMEKAVGYMRGFSCSLAPYSIYAAAFAAFRGAGATKVCMGMSITMNAIYLLASILFLNVLKLDIAGTALAYNVARIIGAAMSLVLITRPGGAICIGLHHVLTVSRPILRSIARLAVPFAVEQIFFNGGTLLAQTYMVQLGALAVAANAVGNSAFLMLYCTGTAVANLTITLVGQCVGRGDRQLARQYARGMLLLGTLASLASIALFLPLMNGILSLYAPPEETLSLVRRLLYIAMAGLPLFWALSNVLPNALRAAGDAGFTTAVSLVSLWAVRVGLGYVLALPLGLGVSGVWVAMVLEWAARGLVFLLRYRGEAWLSKKTLEE